MRLLNDFELSAAYGAIDPPPPPPPPGYISGGPDYSTGDTPGLPMEPPAPTLWTVYRDFMLAGLSYMPSYVIPITPAPSSWLLHW